MSRLQEKLNEQKKNYKGRSRFNSTNTKEIIPRAEKIYKPDAKKPGRKKYTLQDYENKVIEISKGKWKIDFNTAEKENIYFVSSNATKVPLINNEGQIWWTTINNLRLYYKRGSGQYE